MGEDRDTVLYVGQRVKHKVMGTGTVMEERSNVSVTNLYLVKYDKETHGRRYNTHTGFSNNYISDKRDCYWTLCYELKVVNDNKKRKEKRF